MRPCRFPFVHPSTIIIGGPTMSGKTRFLLNVLKHRLIKPFPTRIIWFYGQNQPAYDKIKKMFPRAEFVKGFDVNKADSITPDERNLIILDDLMGQTKDSQALSDLFTQGAHHRNATVVFIVQNLFPRSNNGSMRNLALNAQYKVVFKNPSDKRQPYMLVDQMGGGGDSSRWLREAFDDATRKPFGYMVFDSRPDTNDKYRFRTQLFVDSDNENDDDDMKGPIVYAPRV